MNIPKAIEILTYSLNHRILLLNQDEKDAIQLGIEALKKIDYLHITNVLGEDELLPGETPE